MSRYQTSHRIEGPFIDSDPIAELIRFYRANGYALEKTTRGALPGGLDMIDQQSATSEPSASADSGKSPQDEDPSNTTAEEAEDSNDPDAPTRDAFGAEHADDEHSDEQKNADQAPEESTGEDPYDPDVQDSGEEDSGEEHSDDEDEDSDDEAEISSDADFDERGEEDSNDLERDEDPDDLDYDEGFVDEEASEIVVSATLIRGKEGASIWTSNMSELHAILDVSLEAGAVHVNYDIETTLQHFTDDDRAFWKKEASKAESFVTGKVDAIIDWRENESIRIERQQRDIVMFGLQMMVVAAILAAILYFAFV